MVRSRALRGLITIAALLLACGLSPLQLRATLILSPDGATVYDTLNNITWLADVNRTPPFSTTKNVNVTASNCNVPAAAKAYVFNATVVPPGPLGFITMWPQGQTQPLVATLNAIDGAITNNMAIVPTTNGSISVFPFAPTHLVLDLFGYFAP